MEFRIAGYSVSVFLLVLARCVAAAPATSFENTLLPIFSKGLSKSDFETAEQYNERLLRLKPQGELFLAAARSLVTYTYRAEEKTLMVALPLKITNGVTLSSHLQRKGEALMQNSFGATASVSQERLLIYEVRVVNKLPKKSVVWVSPGSGGMFPDYILGLPILLPPETAKRAVQNKDFTVVLGLKVGDLAQANIDKTRLGPSLDFRRNISMTTYTVPAEVVHVLVMYLPTRSIVASWSLASGYGRASLPALEKAQ